MLRRISSPRTKLLAARCECLHLIKIDCLALRLDESAHASLAASCEELRARTGNPPLHEAVFFTTCMRRNFKQSDAVAYSQSDNLVLLCKFKLLSLFISLEIDCFHSQ